MECHVTSLQNYEPGIEEVVDEGVDHGIGHGQPVEEQVNVFDVAVAGDARIVVHRNEVQVIRQPAQGEQRHHHDEHPHNLHDTSQSTFFRFSMIFPSDSRVTCPLISVDQSSTWQLMEFVGKV